MGPWGGGSYTPRSVFCVWGGFRTELREPRADTEFHPSRRSGDPGPVPDSLPTFLTSCLSPAGRPMCGGGGGREDERWESAGSRRGVWGFYLGVKKAFRKRRGRVESGW